MEAQEIYDLVIVGGGAGGLTAGIYAKRAAMNVVLVEKGAPGGQMNVTEDVENYPGFKKVGGQELSRILADHAVSYDLPILAREVTAVEPGLEYHEVKLDDGRSLMAHAVILAMGGSPRRLGVAGELENYGKGVSYCATCDGFFYRDRNVLVIGGGDTAAEEALYLAKIATKVYMAHRRDELRASRILQERISRECKIEMLWSTVMDVIKTDQYGVNAAEVRSLKTDETRALEVEGVFIFVGFDPNNQLVPKGVRLSSEGYVITDEKCETTLPGIYAIGDLRQKYARQIVLSAADGCTAALAAAHYVEAKKAAAACELPMG